MPRPRDREHPDLVNLRAHLLTELGSSRLIQIIEIDENIHVLVCGDGRLMFLDSVRDPQQLQPTWDRVIALAAQTQKQQQSSKARR